MSTLLPSSNGGNQRLISNAAEKKEIRIQQTELVLSVAKSRQWFHATTKKDEFGKEGLEKGGW